MISINRPTACPSVLAGSPTQGDHYNRASVVKALWRMQHGKCCYCERPIPRSGGGQHVEHFRPQSDPKFKPLRNHWGNLLLACPQCNIHKGKQFPKGHTKLIDPSGSPDPEQHIDFVTNAEDPDELIGMIMENGGSARGRITIDVIRLGSVDNCRDRHRYYRKQVLPLYERMKEANRVCNSAELRQVVSEFEPLMSSKTEFAGFVRSFARNMDLDKDYGVTIPTVSKPAAKK